MKNANPDGKIRTAISDEELNAISAGGRTPAEMAQEVRRRLIEANERYVQTARTGNEEETRKAWEEYQFYSDLAKQIPGPTESVVPTPVPAAP
ncbi:hypothetical protein [Noviherbaspirillum pedocola]|uniref:Uncharacterized protein n=1 Tax=Noviherbaspirillum pedocola TaxID=2801341 RepID=A0A934W6T7_9BURK|nr:hypothetical protein [Noviherbaspirillum pedocola]MBK4736587.1 hypothetical protein [Noviherbaspirillum pedocola]